MVRMHFTPMIGHPVLQNGLKVERLSIWAWSNHMSTLKTKSFLLLVGKEAWDSRCKKDWESLLLADGESHENKCSELLGAEERPQLLSASKQGPKPLTWILPMKWQEWVWKRSYPESLPMRTKYGQHLNFSLKTSHIGLLFYTTMRQ